VRLNIAEQPSYLLVDVYDFVSNFHFLKYRYFPWQIITMYYRILTDNLDVFHTSHDTRELSDTSKGSFASTYCNNWKLLLSIYIWKNTQNQIAADRPSQFNVVDL